MLYQFNQSKVYPLSDERILIPCYHRSNQRNREFYHIRRMRYQLYWRRLVLFCLWGQDSSVLRFGCEVLERENTQFLERGLYPISN